MRRNGITDFTVERDGKEITLPISWHYEVSEYGDGSPDVEFWIEIIPPKGENKILLTASELDDLQESLEKEGAFA